MNLSVQLGARCVIAGCLLSAPLPADFSYQETSRVTGGSLFGVMKMAGTFSRSGHRPTDPIASTIAIKGNRMVRKSEDLVTITDLDKQTITTIHIPKRTYSVMTFAEFREQMEKMSRQMQSKDSQNTSVDVKVSDTGQSKTIEGSQAHEMLLTMNINTTDPQTGNSGSMSVVEHAWISPDVPGYAEASDFYKRMADALGFATGANPMLNRPDIAKAMAEIYRDGSKFRGVPIESTIELGAVAQTASGAGQAQATSTAPSPSSANTAAPTSLSSGLASALGSRFGRHKKQSDDGAPSDNGSASSALIEMTLHAGGFSSSSVDESIFATPDGYKQVAEELTGGRRH